MVGQGARVIVGLKKKYDNASENWFDAKLLATSLMIGGIAGACGAIFLLDQELEKQTLLALVTIGYAGTDFIEGFMKKKLPH